MPIIHDHKGKEYSMEHIYHDEMDDPAEYEITLDEFLVTKKQVQKSPNSRQKTIQRQKSNCNTIRFSVAPLA